LEIVKPPLTRGQRKIVEAIERLRRDQGAPPSAPDIATVVGRPQATVKVELQLLERERYVCRPNGIKSGWDVMQDDDLVLVPVGRR
jgi:SOS-response transcriptional repressor LexA